MRARARRVRDYFVLPELTRFEREYLKPLLPLGAVLLVLHVPLVVLVAVLNHRSLLEALLGSAFVLSGPMFAFVTLPHRPRVVTRALGVGAVGFGALLVHLGQGPMQIEMHFHFFVVIALLTIFGDPRVIITAAGVVVLQHLVFFYVSKSTVFNYDAPLSAVGVHAAFLVAETVGACIAARRYYDHVVGLDSAVEERTSELTTRNRQLQLVLDSAVQGFALVRRDGTIAEERSTVLSAWLGEPKGGQPIWDWVAASNAEAAGWIEAAWDMYASGTLPASIALAQVPSRFRADTRTLGITLSATEDDLVFVVVSDETAQVEREHHAEVEQQLLALVRLAMRDREAFEEFLNEGDVIVQRIIDPSGEDLVSLRRLVHTLKGNSALFGLEALARLCHEIEDNIGEASTLTHADVVALDEQWTRLCAQTDALGLSRAGNAVEIDETHLASLTHALREGASPEEVADALDAARLEPVALRLRRLANDAAETARKLDKVEPFIHIEDNGVRLERTRWRALWSALVHVVRNAVDHGLESPAERRAKGKKERGDLTLRCVRDDTSVTIEIEDDGRGVDWQALRERALRAGLPHATHEDLASALLTDGISTRAAVTETSGRGIGMAALRAEVQRLGGHLELESTTGAGTLVRCRFTRDVAHSARGSGLVPVAKSA